MLKEEFNELYLYNEIESPYYRNTDEYNTAFFRNTGAKWKRKGREPNPLPDEFYDAPELMDADDVRRAQAEEDDRDTDQKQWNPAQSAVSGMVRSAMMLAAGMVVVTASYNTAVEQREAALAADVPSVTDSEDPTGQENGDTVSQYDYSQIEWLWSEDGMTVTAIIPGWDGTVTALTVTPDITYDTTDATCTEDGLRITTATLHAPDGTIYTDVKEAVLPATGHSFEELTADESSIIYRCPDCGAEIKVEITVEEETAVP